MKKRISRMGSAVLLVLAFILIIFVPAGIVEYAGDVRLNVLSLEAFEPERFYTFDPAPDADAYARLMALRKLDAVEAATPLDPAQLAPMTAAVQEALARLISLGALPEEILPGEPAAVMQRTYLWAGDGAAIPILECALEYPGLGILAYLDGETGVLYDVLVQSLGALDLTDARPCLPEGFLTYLNMHARDPGDEHFDVYAEYSADRIRLYPISTDADGQVTRYDLQGWVHEGA